MEHWEERRPLLVSRAWVQAALLVFLFGFFVLGLLAYRTYSEEPPIPAKVTDPGGREVFTGADVIAGQKLFLRNGLMQFGSIFGHGAYLGPDYTADYLHRSALIVRDRYGGEGSDVARTRTIEDFRTNRYSEEAETLELTDARCSPSAVREHYAQFFGAESNANGLRREAITDPEHIHQLAAYFAWSAWAASAERPGHNYTYTNNWPPEPLVDNEPTANVIVWSVLRHRAPRGVGLLFAAFGRWRFLGWHGREQRRLVPDAG